MDIKDVKAIVSEHFTDYVILVRTNHGIEWISSDRTWAMGAVKRFTLAVDCEEMAPAKPLEE